MHQLCYQTWYTEHSVALNAPTYTRQRQIHTNNQECFLLNIHQQDNESLMVILVIVLADKMPRMSTFSRYMDVPIL